MSRRIALLVPLLAAVLLAAAAPLVGGTAARAASLTPDPRGPICGERHDLWFGLIRENPLERVREGWLGTPTRPAYKVAHNGDVDWTLDPYRDLTWQMWLDSFAWTRALVLSYDETGNQADLDLALAYLRDYVTDQPMDASTPDRPVLQQTSHRLQTMICLRERLDPVPQWLDTAIEGTVAFLEKNWAGLWNHGQNQDMAILAAGCAMGRSDWTALANRRLTQTLAVSIDSQGATNEQAANYANHSYQRWADTLEVYENCGLPPIPGLDRKVALARQLVVHATQPDGLLAMIGDTAPTAKGLTDDPPSTALSRVWTDAGWAFGRSAWRSNANYFTLRFGPGRTLHGHPDHGSVSYYANRARVITEPGLIGYTHPDVPWFRYAPEAHNTLLVGNGRCHLSKRAVASVARPRLALDRYVVSWPSCHSSKVTREVRYTRSNGTLAVADSTNRLKANATFQQLWHLVPGAGVTARRTSKHVVVVKLTMPNRSKATLTVRSAKKVPFTFSVVKGRKKPYQGWVSGGINNPVPARVLVLQQRARQADLQATLTPR